MKKLFSYFTMSAVCISFILIYGSAFAEPYQSSKFPSIEIIEKQWKIKNSKFTLSTFQYLGKVDKGGGYYKVYIKYGGKSSIKYGKKSSGIEVISLQKLDTKIWMYDGNKTILQK